MEMVPGWGQEAEGSELQLRQLGLATMGFSP